MARKKGKISFDAMVKFFIQNYDIPTTKDLEKLIDRMDRLEHLVITTSGGASGRRLSGGKTSRGKAPMTASDTVLEIVRSFKDGVGFSEIQDRTGYDEKKLRNIIFRLNNTGKIQRKERGIYTAS